jgi:hypothetical protein
MAKEPTTQGLINLAESLTERQQTAIARELIEDYQRDCQSRTGWLKKRNAWYKLWLGERAPKTDPWPGASNVCVPMLSSACNQFHGRAYQAIFSPPELVKVLPKEAGDVQRAKDVQGYMNYQLMYEQTEYEEEFDRMLLALPINGLEFQKTYYDPVLGRNVSEHANGTQVVVPYRTAKLEKAARITHNLWLHYHELRQRNAEGRYVRFARVQREAGKKDDTEIGATRDMVSGEEEVDLSQAPKLILEMHTRYKLPGSKSYLPYVFTIDFDSETILRITNRRITVDGVSAELNHFTDYHFIPNPEGFYSFGFGHFLEQLNEMANTGFNQIYDSGRLTNQPFGFYGRRAGFKRSRQRVMPGSMIEVEDATQINFPQMQRVDQVLFSVLGLIQQYGEHISSNSDYLMGRESRGTKTPTAHGTLAIIEQGLVTFGVLTKRVFRQQNKAFFLQYQLNSLYLPESKQYRVVGGGTIPFPTIKRRDFAKELDLFPVGDPSFASRSIRRQSAMELYTMLLSNPLIGINQATGQIGNPRAIWHATSDLIDSYDKKNKDELLPPLPPEAMSPEMENARFMQGDEIEPTVGENIEQHLQTHQAFKLGPYYADMPAEYRTLLDTHIEKTKALQYLVAHARAALGGPQAFPQPQPQGGAGGEGTQGQITGS